MSHIFEIQPNLTLLNKHEYLNLSEEELNAAILKQEKLFVEVDAIYTEEKRRATEDGFKEILKYYRIEEHYETLLYICLVESNHGEIQFQHKFDAYNRSKFDKELAQLLFINNPDSTFKPNSIKVSSITDTVKITNDKLIAWIGKLINNAIEQGNFNPTELSETIFSFIADDQGSITSNNQTLNYNRIQQVAEQTTRKPGIRERNRFLAPFLFRVLAYLNEETILTTREGVRFSDDQLNFLFEVAELLDWVRAIDINSEPKDYIYTLLMNFLRL
ncbi:hypothetical protein [Mucilaginibacter sp.]